MGHVGVSWVSQVLPIRDWATYGPQDMGSGLCDLGFEGKKAPKSAVSRPLLGDPAASLLTVGHTESRAQVLKGNP